MVVLLRFEISAYIDRIYASVDLFALGVQFLEVLPARLGHECILRDLLNFSASRHRDD